MSYLPNGSTLRATFRLMPPTTHHLDPSKSEVIGHIRRTLDYGQDEAVRAFGSMRNPKSGVLVFDRVHRVWRGCDWVPDDEAAKKDFMARQIAELRREMKREIAGLRRELKELRKFKFRGKKNKVANKEDDSEGGESSFSEELREIFGPHESAGEESRRSATTDTTVEDLVRQAWS